MIVSQTNERTPIKMRNLYLDGKQINITLTDLEKKLCKQLSEDPYNGFGDLENDGLASVRNDGMCGHGCLANVDEIKWADRQQLGGIISSLVQKQVVIYEEGACGDDASTIWHDIRHDGLWFDGEAIKALLED